jgi:WD40 repeat protein
MESVPLPFHHRFITDMDFTLWNKKVRCIISFYDYENTQSHHVFLPDARVVTMPSPVIRCVLYEDPEQDMGAIVVTQEGRLYQVTWEGNNTSNKIVCHGYGFSEPVFRAEFFPPFMYVLDMNDMLHVYCPKKKIVIASSSFPFSHPVVRFHVHSIHATSEMQITAALADGSVHLLSFLPSSPDDKIMIQTEVQEIVRVKGKGVMALAVYSDNYKIVVAWEDGTVCTYDVNTGKLWNRYDSMMDPSYFTRMFVNHGFMALDGTPEGLEIHTLLSKVSNEIINEETKKELDDFFSWIQPIKPAEFSYIKYIMETPVFSKEQLTLNWTFHHNNNSFQ